MKPRVARCVFAGLTALVAVVALAKPALLVLVGVALAAGAVLERVGVLP